MNKKTPLYSGMLGGGIVIALFITVLLSANLFNYRIRIDKVNINAIQLSDTLKIKNNTDSIYQSRVEFKQTLVEDLKNDKSILTPQEYTNNIVNYYNSILLILSVMLAAFSVLVITSYSIHYTKLYDLQKVGVGRILKVYINNYIRIIGCGMEKMGILSLEEKPI